LSEIQAGTQPVRSFISTISSFGHNWKPGATRAVLTALGVALVSWPSPAEECPTQQSTGFVVERNERQKSEVFHGDQNTVRTVMRYDGTTLLETTYYEGLFLLDRLDHGRRTKYLPRTDLKALFPMKPGRRASAQFTTEADGQSGQLTVEFVVKPPEEMDIGRCKYSVLRIEHSESRGAGPAQFLSTDFYSPELKLVLAREYKDRNGRTELIKYDRIYPIKD
jgi:hypothetical protein